MRNDLYLELTETLTEDYGDFLSEDEIESYSFELCEAIMCIEDILYELDDVNRCLDEAGVPNLIWRTLNKNKANAIQVGFDPRTFDSNKKSAGTNDGGGTIVAGPDKVKQWYNVKHDKQVDKRAKATMKADRDAKRKRKMREFDAAFKEKKITPRKSFG